MKHIVVAVAIVAGAAITACGRDAREAEMAEASVRSEIVQQIQAGIQATRNKDVDAYIDQIPTDVRVAGPDGEPVTREALREQITRAWEAIEATRALDVIVDTIVYHGDSATVLTTTRWDRLIRRPETSIIDTVLSVKKQSETWRPTPSGWRAYAVSSIGGSTTVNGEPILPGADRR